MSAANIVRRRKSCDLSFLIPKDLWMEYKFMKNDSFIVCVEDNRLSLTPVVRVSRLKREWKKYMRRMKNSNISFDIYRADKQIGKLVPNENIKLFGKL